MTEFKSLLPPNATHLELAAEEAITYNPDVSALAGFKLKATTSNLGLLLAWEYSLSQIPIEDLQERIKQGIKFHMYCGTPYALRLALSWYGFENIKIEEEEPGAHFAEFQIGLDEIPNDLDAYKMVEVSLLAAPLRSRLSRMYNDLWDIRRFVLDESPWGDLLSDHSGYQLYPDGPKFSFGRINNYGLDIPTPATGFFCDRHRFAYAVNMDTYRLDWAILDETSPGALNHDMSREAHRYIFNTDFAGDKMGTVLGDINTCFSCGTIVYDETPFTLNFNFLSEVTLASAPELIAYRNWREGFRTAISQLNPTVERGYRSREYASVCDLSAEIKQSRAMERFNVATYKGNYTWHDQQHFDVSWEDQKNYLGQMRG